LVQGCHLARVVIMNRLLLLICLLGLIVLLPGCSWIGGWFGKRTPSQGVLSFQVDPWFGPKAPVTVVACRWKKGKRGDAVGSHKVSEDGSVNFVLPMDRRYSITAYADLNRNGRRDKTEPTASVDNLQPLSPYGSGPAYQPLKIQLPGQGRPRPKSRPQAAGRSLTDEDLRRLKLLQEHLPAGVKLPGGLQLPE